MDRRRLIASLGLIGISGCLRAQDSETNNDGEASEEGGDSTDTGSNDEGPDGQVVELSRGWDPPGFIPRTRAGELFFGMLYAPRRLGLVTSSGSIVWESDPLDEDYGLKKSFGDKLAINGSYVCYGSQKHEESNRAKLYCFSRDTGEILWTHRTEDGPRDTRVDYVTLGDGHVYYGTGTAAGSSAEQDPFVRAVDISSGELVWETSYKAATYDGLLYHDGELYVQRLSQLHILDSDTGSERESHPFETGIGGFVEFDDTLYGIHGDVYAFDLSSNEPEYTEPVGRRPNSWIAATDRHLYAGDDDGWVDAYDRRTGEREWEARVEAGVRDRPAVTDEYVWAVDQDTVYGLDRDSGDIVYESQEDYVSTPIAIDDVVVLVIRGDAQAYRVELG
jgi:outer membrane protein assembly factor BamB